MGPEEGTYPYSVQVFEPQCVCYKFCLKKRFRAEDESPALSTVPFGHILARCEWDLKKQIRHDFLFESKNSSDHLYLEITFEWDEAVDTTPEIHFNDLPGRSHQN